MADMDVGIESSRVEPYYLAQTALAETSVRCNRCVYDGTKFCRIASEEEMRHAAKRLVRYRIPVPPCLKWVEGEM